MARHPLRLGALDFGFTSATVQGARVPHLTVEAARHADALGFSRYWLGEHHHGAAPFGPSPETLLPALAALTPRIHVGVGAVLLNYYRPLKVASHFKLVESLFPGRVDLGIGRGQADNPRSHRALTGQELVPGSLADEGAYTERLEELMAFLGDGFPEGHALHGAACPKLPAPQVWMCGGRTAGTLAARVGAAFCLSLFHGPVSPDPAVVEHYFTHFQPRAPGDTPRVMLAVAGSCVEDAAGAARAYEGWKEFRFYPPTLVGTGARWREEAEALRERYAADELLVLDIARPHEDRLASMSRLAEAFGLQGVRDVAA
ncbi:luciferase-like monooxygenase family protein [Corallococcus coralloides]|uniref:Luciferase-like monooxygenase family protein n=1 Tax=Corallococcus coralloides TaxID=184914 RepID=A0A410RQZ1_CORCK|nr:LLM class flavin-dependent oxidoreductase [Corallococcus coralloides]QAT84324.1 luciferase-like monooxygenase family protein [Corallococcus coralloides]